MKRISSVTILAMVFTVAFAAPVFAAVPDNDTYAGRTVIGSIPFSDALDTTEASTDADDVEMNTAELDGLPCGAPATDASVWYEYTAASDEYLVVDMTGSDYTAGAIVATGAPGSFSLVACGPDMVVFFAAAGETYTILAFDDQLDEAGTGGNLVLSLDVVPPPPEIDITVDPVGTFDAKTGSATVSGTVTCSASADYAFIDVQLQQQVGRFIIRGYGGIDAYCDGTAQPWTVDIYPDTGLFKGGKAATIAFGYACGVFDCGFDEESVTIRLKK